MESKISGLYKGFFPVDEEKPSKRTELELRIDVDGDRPLGIISGDLFLTDSDIHEHLNSFRFQVKDTQKFSKNVQITGSKGEFSSSVDTYETIRVSINQNSRQAYVQLINNSTTVNCSCEHKSEYFRSILIEHDFEEEVAFFESYDTNKLISPSRRTQPLSIISAFDEAGIEVKEKRKQKLIPHPKSEKGEDPVWTDSRLYDAMLEHFTKTKDEPQWNLWLLSAHEYVICTVKGIMLIHKGKSRRGCSIFQIATGWQSPEEKRLRLFIYMHELGHCFNLSHPWNKPNTEQDYGFSILSWMNYPWRYRLSEEIYGTEEFWKAFNFQFSDSELMHLRHGFRNAVIFGGNGQPDY